MSQEMTLPPEETWDELLVVGARGRSAEPSAFLTALFDAGQRKHWPELGRRERPKIDYGLMSNPARAIRRINGNALDLFSGMPEDEAAVCAETWVGVTTACSAVLKLMSLDPRQANGALMFLEQLLIEGEEAFRGATWWPSMRAQISASIGKLALIQPSEV